MTSAGRKKSSGCDKLWERNRDTVATPPQQHLIRADLAVVVCDTESVYEEQ